MRALPTLLLPVLLAASPAMAQQAADTSADKAWPFMKTVASRAPGSQASASSSRQYSKK